VLADRAEQVREAPAEAEAERHEAARLAAELAAARRAHDGTQVAHAAAIVEIDERPPQRFRRRVAWRNALPAEQARRDGREAFLGEAAAHVLDVLRHAPDGTEDDDGGPGRRDGAGDVDVDARGFEGNLASESVHGSQSVTREPRCAAR
jgi:hypothetical protein